MSEEHKRDVSPEAAEPTPVDPREPVHSGAETAPSGAGEVDAAEAAFAASESGLPVEPDAPDADDAPAAAAAAVDPEPEISTPADTPAPVAPVEPGPIAAAVGAVTATRPVWSDAGDAPFDDRRERIPGPAKVRVKDDDEGGPSAASETFEIVKTIVVALAIAFVLRVLLFQPFTIPSASMEPNLYEGDYIVVSKWAYGYSKFSSGLPINLPLGEGRVFGRAPERGDIVVFKLPRDDKTDYIKRVIGLPGDQIQMIGNVLHINGTAVQDVEVSRGEVADIFGPRAMTQSRETLPGGRTFTIQDFGPGGDLDDTPVYEVPQGFYFMMGDNRDNSIDSRVDQSAGVGLVPDENLVGRAEIIAFSWTPGASLLNPISWFANIRLSRFFRVLD